MVHTCPDRGGMRRARMGTRCGAAWGKRAAHHDDFDDDDEPCSARRPRASARAAHVRPRRTDVGLMLASAARRRFTRNAAQDVTPTHLERAEARVATKPRCRVRRKRALGRPTSDERAFARVARAERSRCDARTDMRGGKPRRAVCPRARSFTFSRAMQTA